VRQGDGKNVESFFAVAAESWRDRAGTVALRLKVKQRRRRRQTKKPAQGRLVDRSVEQDYR